jgi:hypothetical protein
VLQWKGGGLEWHTNTFLADKQFGFSESQFSNLENKVNNASLLEFHKESRA